MDYEKAFNSMIHPNLSSKHWGKYEGIDELTDERYICILEDIYTDATFRIHLDGDVSESVKISRELNKKILCHQRCSGVYSSYGGYLKKKRNKQTNKKLLDKRS